MTKIDGIEFIASHAMLRDAAAQEKLPESLLAPFQAVIKHVLEASASKPCVIYLLASEAVRGVRDYFAHALVRVLCQQVPSAVLVDCDFTMAGMGGIVPQKDALGFLDYLLYGSSLGVVTQEASQGVRLIGAGSFPVSKKMPVSIDSFADAARRLASQCRIAVFCGPARDDEENIHPICEVADLLMNVNFEKRFPVGRVEPFEEELARQFDHPVISIRITSAGEAIDAVLDAGPEKRVQRTAQTEPAADAAVPLPEGNGAGEERTAVWREEEEPRKAAFSGLPFERRRSGSIWAKIIPATIAVALIGFLFWWFIITKPMQGGEEAQLASNDTEEAAGQPSRTGRTAQPGLGGEEDEAGEDSVLQRGVAITSAPQEDSTGRAEDQTQEMETLPANGERENAVPSRVEAERGPPPGSEAARAKGTEDEVYVAKDFTEFAGQYLVHISSFRDLQRAKEDAAYLLQNNFTGCVIPVDLGSKGKWFRVYVGPVETREEALQQKIMLDELPRVKFTRITRSPGF